MNSIKIDKIIRTKRRTYSIEINSEAKLIVRVPLKASDKEIMDVVGKKKEWILEKQASMLQKVSNVPKKQYHSGELFLFKGSTFPLQISDDINFIFAFKNNTFLLNSNYREYAELAFTHWYKKVAKGLIGERAVFFARIMNVSFNKLRITSAESRWGSCSGKKNINFTWKLVMAPEGIIDYVVVHELAHLVEMNHSERFWAIVRRYLPDYKARRKWLKENGHMLDL